MRASALPVKKEGRQSAALSLEEERTAGDDGAQSQQSSNPGRRCDTSNPVQVIVAKAETSRSVIGIVDGLSSRAIESEDDKQNRSKLLRDLGYKK